MRPIPCEVQNTIIFEFLAHSAPRKKRKKGKSKVKVTLNPKRRLGKTKHASWVDLAFNER